MGYSIDVNILLANPNPRLVREILGKDVVKFFSHPEMGNDKTYLQEASIPETSRLEDEIYTVTPTASTRTLLTHGRDYNFMIKTDLDKRHYRFIRRLKGSSVLHSVQISQELERITSSGNLEEYSFLPESIGIVAGDKDSGAGVLFREIVPRPVTSNTSVLIPYFSLYAKDLKNPDDLPLLVQLIKHNSRSGDELGYFAETILGKIVRNWTKFATEYGLLIELHGQNTLLEVDESLQPQRIVHRDFQSIYVDRKIREQRGLPIPFRKHIVGEEVGTDRPKQFSIAYDHLVGDFLLDRLARTFLEYFPGYSYQQIANNVKGIFNRGFPNANEIFPNQTYTYGPQVGNVVNLVVKHTEPVFR